ncbi:uncharacterized protein TRAVEDRAFT_131759 [Trametes versicolor FP-101664 SS1]|uniref:uncharacterized protein n=1 Tax=Trametes versicolor (strain FP-101664) TaxID=717944 RepID=UPI0004621E52|nr:uncharacterized protein TRAVEDRAFT_131759 [Trametes versicolor FP-101664 SS1]EIW55307.1 hypothetical protein TRAVEDRAFT_131759 [Trametes versicolor FP-101664 SS1]
MVAIVNALFATAIAQLTSSWSWLYGKPSFQLAGCSIDTFVPAFPSGQTQLVAPTVPPNFIGLAFGVQNYTCSASNNFTSTGAVAELIDVSCIVSQPSFATLQNDLFNAWTNLIPYPIQAVIDLLHLVNPPEVLAQHYFVTNPTTGQGVSPKWDFTSSGAFQGNQNAYIIAKGKGTLPAPTNSTRDVAWLDVTGIQGEIASEVFRFDTVGGQPPSSCVSGQTPDISVKYVSKYSKYTFLLCCACA